MAAILPITPNTEKFASAAACNTRGVHATNGTGEGSCARLATMEYEIGKPMHESCTSCTLLVWSSLELSDNGTAPTTMTSHDVRSQQLAQQQRVRRNLSLAGCRWRRRFSGGKVAAVRCAAGTKLATAAAGAPQKRALVFTRMLLFPSPLNIPTLREKFSGVPVHAFSFAVPTGRLFCSVIVIVAIITRDHGKVPFNAQTLPG